MKPNWDSDADDYKRLEAYMDAVEGNGPQTTLMALLHDAGVDLPPPESLSDIQLTATLWIVINALADLGAFLSSTNHLNDRELYVLLWSKTLREDHPIVTEEFPMVTLIDILGGCSNDDIEIYLRYYADPEERERFAAMGPDPIPEHQEVPFHRDHLLPRPVPST